MPTDGYSVRVDRSAGIVEISGPDKDWIAEQLQRLSSVLEGSPSGTSPKPQTQRTATSELTPDANSQAKPARARRALSGGPSKNDELSALLAPQARTKLQSYVDERADHFKNATEQAAVIATFLLDELKWEAVSGDDIYTVFSDMGWKIPAAASALANAQRRNGFFQQPKAGKFRLSHKGENFGRLDAKASKS